MEYSTEQRDTLFEAPDRLEDLGVSENLVSDLFLKHAYSAGTCTIQGLSKTLCLPVHLTEQLFRNAKARQFVDVRGTQGEDFLFVLSQTGKTVMMERMQISRYTGPVPVSLPAYETAVRAQVARTRLTLDRLSKAYEDLTLAPDFLARLGPALVAQTSMFLYGPSGTGKSSLAERVLRIYDDRIAVPRAVEVEGNIIMVFDASVHRPVDSQRAQDDPRWVFCERPSIIVGGELVPAMLELQKESEAGCYIAPLHVKANNGIFVIDDFGRQLISPKELLNRWIVPLDRRTDYLTITGAKFAVPFEVFVVFSTNLDPTELADEAFLRRIPNKILVDAISAELFDEIVEQRLQAKQWTHEPEATAYLRNVCLERGGDLRACYPRDLFRIVESIAEFEGRGPTLTKEDVSRAAELYYGGTKREHAMAN